MTRPVLAWTLYDVASSTYAGIVPVFFGLYFVSVVAVDGGGQVQWGLLAASTLVLAGLLAPFVGAFVDRRGRWFTAVTAATVACVAALLLLPIGTARGVVSVAILYIVAQLGYTLATSVYDSLLVHVAPRSHAGRISGFGWALGTLGGMVVLVIAIASMQGVPEEGQAARLGFAFVMAGALFAIFAAGALLAMRGNMPALSSAERPRSGVRSSLAAVATTVREWRRQREAFRFLLAYYLISDVLVTLVFFIAIVMRARFGLTVEGMLWLALLSHVISMPATLAFGHAADRWGGRPAIYLMVAMLAVAILLLAFGSGPYTALTVVVLLGLMYAPLQAVCRSFMGSLLQVGNASEMFGFNAVVGRLSAAVGPLLFGMIAAGTGSEAVALVCLLPFLVAGVVVLGSVRVSAAPPACGDAARQP